MIMDVTEQTYVSTEGNAEIARPQRSVSLCSLIAILVILQKDWSKEMEIAHFSDPVEGNFTLRGECPHCRDKAAFMPITKSWHEESFSSGGDKWVAALRCVSCRKYILGIVGFIPGPKENMHTMACIEHYPIGKPLQIDVPGIPAHILSDYNEGVRCQWVEAYNAAAEMCRRAVQASCLHFGADPKRKLGEQIDWLASQGKIIASLKEMAHAIRLGGNRGAHPPDDPKEESPLSRDEASAIVNFTWHFLDSVFVKPAQMKKFDFSRDGRKKLNP